MTNPKGEWSKGFLYVSVSTFHPNMVGVLKLSCAQLLTYPRRRIGTCTSQTRRKETLLFRFFVSTVHVLSLWSQRRWWWSMFHDNFYFWLYGANGNSIQAINISLLTKLHEAWPNNIDFKWFCNPKSGFIISFYLHWTRPRDGGVKEC